MTLEQARKNILGQSRYRISSNKRQVLSNRRPLICAARLGIHIEISPFSNMRRTSKCGDY